MQIQSNQDTKTNNSVPGMTSGACPTFFRAHVSQAQTSRTGYVEAGYHLAIHVERLIDGDVNEEVVQRLHDLAGRRRDDDWPDEMWNWLKQTLPRCMALVPERRKETFLRGFAKAIEDERV